MGQQASRKSTECTCGCGAWERRRFAESPTSVHKYVSAVTDRWSGRDCACRRRRWRRQPCVCTAYRRVSDDRLAAVLTLGARDLRRELDAIVINTDGDNNREIEPAAEVYVLSVAPRQMDNETTQEGRRPDLAQSNDGIRLHQHFQVWSDCKNNTKKKARKIHRAVGPGAKLVLSDVELRVLGILNTSLKATGIKQIGTNVISDIITEEHGATSQPLFEIIVVNDKSRNRSCSSPKSQPLSPSARDMIPSPMQCSNHSSYPPSPPPLLSERPLERTNSQARPFSRIRCRPEPSLTRQTRRLKTSRKSHIDNATLYFMESEAKWREFKSKQHEESMETRREENRIRELEAINRKEENRIRSLEAENNKRALDLLESFILINK